MKVVEVNGDLFNTADYTKEQVVFAHCIASDFGMGAGIATQFIKYFDMKNKLKKWSKETNIPEKSTNVREIYGKPFSIIFRPTLVGTAVRIENTYNLITKTFTCEKPTMDDLTKSLQDMKRQMVKNKEKYLAIPDMIGCGIDGLERSHVLSIIQSVFLMTEITIYIVKL